MMNRRPNDGARAPAPSLRRIRITNAIVNSSRPRNQVYSIRDAAVPELVLQVEPSGEKTWLLRSTKLDQCANFKIGASRTISPAHARALANAKLANARRAEPFGRSLTVAAFEMEYRDRAVSHWKLSSQRSYSHYRKRILDSLGSLRLVNVRRQTVARWYHDYSADYPGGANRALDDLSSFFNRAKEWGHLEGTHPNPCAGIKRNRRRAVGQVINDQGLEAISAGLNRMAEVSPTMADAIEVLAYTGCRPGEIRCLQWTEVESDRLVLKDSKVGPRPIPLGQPAQEILARRRLQCRSKYVFPSPKWPDRPISDSGLRGRWYRLRDAAKLDRTVRLYDVRHSYASHGIMSGESLFMIGRLLGHRRPSTTAGYTHLQDDHLSEANERISQRIATWLDDENGSTRARLVGDCDPYSEE